MIVDRTMVKQASLGGDPDQPFELAFASLAHTYLKDKAPSLVDHVVGFQLLDSSQDKKKAVGIFGAKVGNKWVYCPMFFLNGEMKGHELMWVKDQNIFLPLKENWINFIMGSQPRSLGDPARVTRQQSGERQPDLTPFIRPPYGKYAMEQPELVGDWGLDAVRSFAKLALSPAERPTFAEIKAAIPTLPSLLAEIPALAKVASHWAISCPQFEWSLERMHGRAAVDAMYKSAESYSATPHMSLLKSAELQAVQDGGSLLTGLQLTELPVKTAQSKLDIRVGINSNSSDLSDTARSQLLRDGVLVMDKRAAEEISVAFDEGTPSAMANPTSDGQYKVLLANGELVRCLVVLNPIESRDSGGKAIVVAVGTGREKEFTVCRRSDVFVVDGQSEKMDKTTVDGVTSGLPAVKSLEVGAGYLLFLPNSRTVGVVHVQEKTSTRKYKVKFNNYCSSQDPVRSSQSDILNPAVPVIPPYLPVAESNKTEFTYIEINTREGAGVQFVGDTLLIPASTKVMKLYAGRGENSHWELPDNEQLTLGDLLSAQEKLTNNTTGLRVVRRGDNFSVEAGRSKLGSFGPSREFSKLAAFSHLMTQHGLNEQSAKYLISRADEGLVASCRVKYAAGYGGNPYLSEDYVGGPAFPEAQYSGADPYSGATIMESQEQSAPVDSLQSQPPEMSPMELHTQQPDMELMKQTTDAANKGQRELFDTSALKGLLKTVREDSLINRHLPPLMTALDKCGRLLFLFYWHGKAFENRYGKSDTPELEDMLRSVFEAVGDLVLFLREKEIRPFGAGESFSPDIEAGAETGV